MERDYYTVKELASMVGRDSSTVRRWARTGRIKANQPFKHFEIRIPQDEATRLINLFYPDMDHY